MKHDSNLGYIFDDKIKDQFVFLIDNDGTKHPKISVKEALEIAESKKLSVVIKVPASEERLAIAMIVDKGKFLFDIKKKEKEKAKLVQSTKVKEITVKPRIGDNDLARFAKNTID
jgi:translation initiation factor IF-3